MIKISRFVAWTMWFLAALFYGYQYILRILPGATMEIISKDFALEPSSFSNYQAIYYACYVAFHIPLGLLIDRLGPKIVMSATVLMTALGLLPIAHSDMWQLALLGRAITGIGSAAAILCVFKVIRMGFEEAKFSKMLGIAATFGVIVGTSGGRPLQLLIENYSWNEVVNLITLTGVVLAVLSFVILPKYKFEKVDSSVKQDIFKILSNKRILSISFIGGLMIAPLEGFADAWGAPFLNIFHNFSKGDASFLVLLVLYGFAAGSMILGAISEKFQRYYLILSICGIVMTICFIAILFNQTPSYEFIWVLMILIGMASAYQIFIVFLATTYAEDRLSGLSSSISNSIMMAFGSFFHKIMGITLEIGNEAGNLVRDSYFNLIFIIPAFTALGVIMLIWHYRFLIKKRI